MLEPHFLLETSNPLIRRLMPVLSLSAHGSYLDPETETR